MAKNDGIVFYDEFTISESNEGREAIASTVQGIDLRNVASKEHYASFADALHQGLVKNGWVQK